MFRGRRNVLILAVSQALMLSAMVLNLAVLPFLVVALVATLRVRRGPALIVTPA